LGIAAVEGGGVVAEAHGNVAEVDARGGGVDRAGRCLAADDARTGYEGSGEVGGTASRSHRTGEVVACIAGWGWSRSLEARINVFQVTIEGIHV
jgi:hypothetical protein